MERSLILLKVLEPWLCEIVGHSYKLQIVHTADFTSCKCVIKKTHITGSLSMCLSESINVDVPQILLNWSMYKN